MFTGLIEEIGMVQNVLKGEKSAKITIRTQKVIEDVKLGDSISTNGVCLTVVDFTKQTFTVDVMPETMHRSNLGSLKYGNIVNLERALKVGDRLGGHMVSGHIDGTGRITSLEEEDNATWVTITTDENILKYVVEKGSIAIDGTSLTVAYVDESIIKVSIIPLTRDETTLRRKKIGEQVNIECDMMGKYIEKLLLAPRENQKKQTISIDFLKKNGFA